MEGVRDILGHYFNIDGRLTQSDVQGRIVSFPIPLLPNIKEK